jgi:UDP-N-acetylglucosamine 4,6-dehydratase
MTIFRPTHWKRLLFFVCMDVVLSVVTFTFAFALRFNFESIDGGVYENSVLVLAILLPLKIMLLSVFRVYWVAWRFFGLMEAKRIVYAHVFAYAFFGGIYLVFQDVFSPFPRSILMIDFFLSAFCIGLFRMSKRMVIEGAPHDISSKHTIIIGANHQTQNVIKSYFSGELEYYPACIVESDPKMVGTYLSDIQVRPIDEMEYWIKKQRIATAIITKAYDSYSLDTVFERLKHAHIQEIKLVRMLEDQNERLRDVSIEDLLARKPKDLDQEAIGSFLFGKVVLITGAGGSIGSEVARQCVAFDVHSLILLDNCEYNLYAISEELSGHIRYDVLMSVLDYRNLEAVFAEYQPHIVIHAAAYKHVPICENNITSALENNILGTKHVIDLSIAHHVEKVVLISTDKAVRPTNVMGASKRIAELYAQNVDSNATDIVSVRFGNVLGSSGSVVPKFKSQIASGGPVTVTHPDITRYFMLIPEACQLVLQAGAIAKGREIFILDMGDPVKIVDLAKKLIRLSGKEQEVGIVYSGLRPGEKLFEELLMDESERKTAYQSIHVGKPTTYPIVQLLHDISDLMLADDKLAMLKKIVPEFHHEPRTVKP